ncbi:MAG: PAS domain S-box protein [Myxococcota bacterium]|nr:PAS domain S-box protein [Myxococcota bacterium]
MANGRAMVRELRVRIRTLMSVLIRPNASITDPEERWQAQLFMSLLLPLVALTIMGMATVFSVKHSVGSPWGHILSLAILLGAVGLGRTRHVGLAGILAVIGAGVPTLWLTVEKRFISPADVDGAMVWIAVELAFSVLALSFRRALFMNILLLACLMGLVALLPPHPAMRVAPAISFLWVFFLMTTATSAIYHRVRSGFFAEMRERERAEQLALRSSETLSAVVSSSPAAVIMVNLDGLTELWNPAAEKLFGWRADEVLGKPNPALVSGQDFDATPSMGENRHSRPQLVREVEVPTKSGQTVVVNLSTASVLESSGAPAGIVGVAVDVTTRKQLEAQLRHAQKMEAVGRLAGGVAHDFNNLLTVINGNGEAVRSELGSQHPAHPMMVEVLDAGYRAVTLTRQLLAFSRKQPLLKERLDVHEVVSGMTKLARRLAGPNIELEHRDSDGLWAVEADRGHLEQIILNLVVNAADAMPDGGKLIISCANGRYDPRQRLGEGSLVIPRAVVLTVSDTGQGMIPDVKERIFEPFFTTKAEGKGTGLGLSTQGHGARPFDCLRHRDQCGCGD